MTGFKSIDHCLKFFFLTLFITPTLYSQDSTLIEIGNKEMANRENAVLSGVVSNPKTGELIVGATVYVEESEVGTATNENGFYALILPIGQHNLIFSSIGLIDEKRAIYIYTDGVLDVGLNEQSYSLEEIVISAKPTDQNISQVNAGAIEMTIKDINTLPTLLGEVDVMKSLTLMPGVSTVGEGAAGINVRGGKIDQNLVQFGGAQLFNTSHALGLFSVFNPDVVRNFTLYKGNVPAQYGGRTSSVLDVDIKDGNFKQWKLKAGLGSVNGRLLVEGPLIKDKTSLLLGGRLSYFNWLLRFVNNSDIQNSRVRYNDFNGVLSHKVNEKNTIQLSQYFSNDFFRYSDQFGYQWNTRATTLQWRSILGPDFSFQTTGVWGDYGSTLFEPEGPGAFNFNSGLEYFQLKQNFFLNIKDQHSIHFGAEGIRYNSKPDIISARGSQSSISRQSVSRENGQELGIYFNDEYEISSKLAVSIGLRFSTFQSLGPDTVFSYQEGLPRTQLNIVDTTFFSKGSSIQSFSGFEPRFSLRYRINPKSSVKLSYNRMRQYVHLLSNTAASTPVDVWQLSNRFIEPQISDNFSLGYFLNLSENTIEMSVETFYRSIENQIDYKNFAELLLNPAMETELLTGEGQAYGVEFLLRRNAERLKGWLTYTYTRSFLRVPATPTSVAINNGEWYPAYYDKPHDLTLSTSWRPGKYTTWGLNFTYSTGRPFNGLVSSYEINRTIVPHFSERNAYRIPDYYRLDLSMTINGKKLVT